MKTQTHFVVPSKRRAFRLLGLAVGLFSLALLSLPGLLAQTTLSSIRGTVTDQTGAVVPGVEISVIDVETNISRSSVSDDVGNFEVPNLKLGNYRLEAKMPGFESFVAQDIFLQSNQVKRIDVELQVGEATAEVTVSAAARVIEVEESKLAAALGVEDYQQMPTLGVDHTDPNAVLARLPGVTMVEAGFNMNVAGLSGGNAFEEGNDGAATPGYVNQIQNMEDVEEIKIVTYNNTADHPRAGYFNLVTKRGSNDFHGRLYYYHVNDVWNAREFFQPEVPPEKNHIFGFDMGGPIIKDKTFVYGSWSAIRIPASSFRLATLPTNKMRGGDFSEILEQRGAVIHDPLTGQPFPGNIIPPERMDPVAAGVLQSYYPPPNQGAADLLTRNFGFLHPFPNDLIALDDLMIRIDHRISEDNEVYGKYKERRVPYVLARGLPALVWTRLRAARQILLSDTHIFSPTLTHTFLFGLYNNKIDDGDTVRGITPIQGQDVVAELGIQGVNPQGLEAQGFPRMDITGYTGLSAREGGKVRDENNINIASSTNWTVSRHTLKFGGEVRPNDRFTGTVPEGTFGRFTFNGSVTGSLAGCDPAQVAVCGDGFADFFLGLPFTSTRLDALTNREQRATEIGIYVTDSFKVNQKLTLDLGLRWDHFGAASWEDGLQANFDLNTGNVIVSDLNAVSPLYPIDTISVVQGDAVVRPSNSLFVPRLGFAYRIDDDTVLRGGYGIFNEFLGTYNRLSTVAPFELSETFQTNEVEGGLAFPNPFPSAGLGAVSTQSITGYPADMDTGLIHQFNLTLERQVKDVGLRLSYVGTRARGMNYRRAINKPPPSLIPFSQDRRPYPQFRGVNYFQSEGSINYDALMFRVQKRVGRLTLDTHWTWAHNMSNMLNLEDPHAPLFFNRTTLVAKHRVGINMTYRIPAPAGGSLASRLARDWIITWVGFLQNGQYFSPSYSGSDPSNTNTFGGLPDRVSDGNLPTGQRDVDRWFDLNAFQSPPPGRYGNSGVNILERPGRNTHNVNLTKRFPIGERVTAEYSVAATNLFNHPNFARPNGNISVSGGGQITSDVGIYNLEKAGARKIEMRLAIKW